MAHLGGLPLHDALGALPYLKAAPGRMQTIHGHPQGRVSLLIMPIRPMRLPQRLALCAPRPAASLLFFLAVAATVIRANAQ